MESEHRTVGTHVKIIDAANKLVPVADWEISFGLRTILVQIKSPVNAPPAAEPKASAAKPKASALYVVVDKDGDLRTKGDCLLLTLEQARTFCEQDNYGPHSIIPLDFFMREMQELRVNKLIAARFAAEQAEDA